MPKVPDLNLPRYDEYKYTANKNSYTYSVKIGSLWYKFFQAKKKK